MVRYNLSCTKFTGGNSDVIPDEETALKTGGPAWPGQRQLPPNVTNQVQDMGDGTQMVIPFCCCLAVLKLRFAVLIRHRYWI